MAKTLSQRIAERTKTKEASKKGKNRASFLAVRDEVRQSVEDGWAIKEIWGCLHAEGKVSFGYDSGLVSLAFHPKFAQNGYVYLAYMVPYPTQPPPPNVAFLSVLGRFQSKDGGHGENVG